MSRAVQSFVDPILRLLEERDVLQSLAVSYPAVGLDWHVQCWSHIHTNLPYVGSVRLTLSVDLMQLIAVLSANLLHDLVRELHRMSMA